jgi:hypothetical protein
LGLGLELGLGLGLGLELGLEPRGVVRHQHNGRPAAPQQPVHAAPHQVRAHLRSWWVMVGHGGSWWVMVGHGGS